MIPTLDLVAVAEVDDSGIVGLLLSLQRFSVGACRRGGQVATLVFALVGGQDPTLLAAYTRASRKRTTSVDIRP